VYNKGGSVPFVRFYANGIEERLNTTVKDTHSSDVVFGKFDFYDDSSGPVILPDGSLIISDSDVFEDKTDPDTGLDPTRTCAILKISIDKTRTILEDSLDNDGSNTVQLTSASDSSTFYIEKILTFISLDDPECISEKAHFIKSTGSTGTKAQLENTIYLRANLLDPADGLLYDTTDGLEIIDFQTGKDPSDTQNKKYRWVVAHDLGLLNINVDVSQSGSAFVTSASLISPDFISDFGDEPAWCLNKFADCMIAEVSLGQMQIWKAPYGTDPSDNFNKSGWVLFYSAGLPAALSGTTEDWLGITKDQNIFVRVSNFDQSKKAIFKISSSGSTGTLLNTYMPSTPGDDFYMDRPVF